jgi:release factor glutamine methyltransferase
MTTLPAVRTVGFGPLSIDYDDRVLRPREWTTRQAVWAANLLADAPDGPVLELCSGAGQIGLLTARLSHRPLVCVDVDPLACDYARANAVAAGLGDRVEVRAAELEAGPAPDERFPLVLADPPWVPRAETGRYPEDPLRAIDGGPDGMDLAWRCLAVAARHVHPDGHVLLQLGTAAQTERLGDAPVGGALRVAGSQVYEGQGVLVHLVPGGGAGAAG